MKKTTQKFLAKLLVLLLVLGLVPEVWGTVALATGSQSSSVNNPYIWDVDTSNNVTGSSVNLYWYGNGYGRRTLTLGGITENTIVTWYIGSVQIRGSTINTATAIDSYLRAYVDNGNLVIYTNGTYTGSSNYYVYATVDGKSYSCTVYTSNNIYNGNYLASVTVYGSYSLGSLDDNGGTSIVSQLSNYYGFSYLRFTSTPSSTTYGSINASTNTSYTASQLSNLVFTPNTSTGTVTFPVALYSSNGTLIASGYIAFNISGTATTGDITYSGSLGDTIYFDVSDFEDFYYSKTNGGTLNYVTFSTPSTGTGSLYSDGTRLSSTSYCYASPTSSRLALDGVYFTPSGTTATRASTVRITFTAVGTRSYSSNSTVSGAVVINYLNGTAKDITYTPVGGSVKLDPNDFTAIYRDVMGSTAPSGLTIQFQEVPTYGTLTYKSSSSSSSAVTLKASNIKSYSFSTSSSGTRRLSDVTYTNTSSARTDSIEYIAYTNGVARFTGNVVFNPNSTAVTVTVTKTCGSTGTAFSLTDFTNANPTVLASTTQITFTIPAHGTLTYAGSPVTYTGVTVPVNMVSQVFYRPSTGFTGTDRVAFTCLNASGSQVGTGQMTITVSGTTSSGTNIVSQFTDVPANAWYYTSLSSLVSRGLVQGVGNNKVEPRGTLDYGQALKMVLLAAGYPAQQELSGSNWAQNYKTYAVSNGFISDSINLTDPITRDAVVELAARALKIAPVTTNSPFSDSNNGYAIALYRTTPQIITGYTNGTFGGSNTLLRQEVWEIIYKMLQYTDSRVNTQMPDGI